MSWSSDKKLLLGADVLDWNFLTKKKKKKNNSYYNLFGKREKKEKKMNEIKRIFYLFLRLET